MKTASWIILLVAGVLTLLASTASTYEAYRSTQEQFGSATMTELTAGKPDVETALRGRRATAAAFAAGFAVLFLMIVLGPYRRGDRWAWWAILVGMLVVVGLILLRVPLLGAGLGGTGFAALIQLGLVALGLALGAGRLKAQ